VISSSVYRKWFYYLYVPNMGVAEEGGSERQLPSLGGQRVGMGRRNEIQQILMPLNLCTNIDFHNSRTIYVNILNGLNSNL
jgi:hypothetical protein